MWDNSQISLNHGRGLLSLVCHQMPAHANPFLLGVDGAALQQDAATPADLAASADQDLGQRQMVGCHAVLCS